MTSARNAILACLVSAVGHAQSPRFDARALETLAAQELREIRAPGAAVAIVSGDRVVFAKGFGVASIETGVPVQAETLFRIGSVTKMLTAAAIASAAEEHKLDLQRPIGEYVSGLSPKLAGVTLHQLLSHTSGLKDDFSHYGPHDESALVPSLRRYDATAFAMAPGEGFTYSGLGYGIAGGVLEAAGGAPFAAQFAARILNPLGMARSTFRPTMAMTWPFSQGHIVSGNAAPVVVRPYDDTTTRWASGFLFCNVTEFARFVIAFLNDGRLDEKQVLSPAVIKRLSTPYADPLTSPDEKYGYGLVIGKYRSVRILKHPGSRRGFRSLVTMAPDQRFAIIVFVNRQQGMLYKTIEKAMEMFLPLGPKPAPAPHLPLTPQDLAEAVGVYDGSDISGARDDRTELFTRAGQLFGKSHGVEWPLYKIGPSRYAGWPPYLSQSQEFRIQKSADGRTVFLYYSMDAHKRIAP